MRTTTAEQQAFLATVSSLNDRWEAVRAGSIAISLSHSFWSDAEIENAEKVKADWGVPEILAPFYGDWHDLICLNVESGAIEMLDDDRHCLFAWQSPDEFLNCLEHATKPLTDTSGIIESESWLEF